MPATDDVAAPAFATVLREYRRNALLSIESLAAASGVSARAIAAMEAGTTSRPRRSSVLALARGLALGQDATRRLAAAAGHASADEPGSADLVGRSHLLKDLGDWATARTARGSLLLYGPPGVGKTALATCLASELGRRTGARVSTWNPISAAPVDPRFADIQILDDVVAESQVRNFLTGGSAHLVIATSRMPLSGLETARRIQVPPLSREDSVLLLGSLRHLQPTREEKKLLDTVADWCSGLPVALRRAAAVPGSLAALHTRLGDPRQRYAHLHVHALVEPSYQRLGDQAARMLRSLALVPGHDLAAPLAAALAGLDLEQADDLLEELVEAGLLAPTDDGRYVLLDLIRLHAGHRLDQYPEERQQGQERLNAWLLGQ